MTLELRNQSTLPIPWLQFSERLPLRLGYTAPHVGAAYIPGHAVRNLHYTVRGSRRGLYALGPLTLSYGDIFGFEERILRGIGADQLIVYPKIVPLEQLLLPSRTPLGPLRSRNPLSEDPTRVIGVRDYQRGDSIRRIHWPATARAGRLQVKTLEPALTLQTVLFLDLHPGSYDTQLRDHYQELAIVVAASVTNRLIELRQAVGLVSNGAESGSPGAGENGTATPAGRRGGAAQPPIAAVPPILIPAGRGHGHAIRLLEALARAEGSDELALDALLQRYSRGLGWGTTAVVITGALAPHLAPSLNALKRNGYTVLLIIVGGRHGLGDESGLPADVLTFRVREEASLPAMAEAFRG